MWQEILWFLPWCVGINISFDLLIWSCRTFPRIGAWNVPVDSQAVLPDGRRLLGDSTTWLGLIQACTLGVVGVLLVPGQYFFLLAILVWVGHATGSFIKRRLGFPRGVYVPGIDHIDYVVVAGAALYLLGRLSIAAWVTSIIIMMLVTPALTYIAYRLHIRLRPL